MKPDRPAITIPTSWPPSQAMAFLDLLEVVHGAIWDAYETQLIDLILADLQRPADDDTHEYEHEQDQGDDIPW